MKGQRFVGIWFTECKRRTAKFKRKPRTLVKRKIWRKLREVEEEVEGTKWKKYRESSGTEKSPNASAKKFDQKLLSETMRNVDEEEEKKVRGREMYKNIYRKCHRVAEWTVPCFLFFFFFSCLLWQKFCSQNIIHEALETSILCFKFQDFNP